MKKTANSPSEKAVTDIAMAIDSDWWGDDGDPAQGRTPLSKPVSSECINEADTVAVLRSKINTDKDWAVWLKEEKKLKKKSSSKWFNNPEQMFSGPGGAAASFVNPEQMDDVEDISSSEQTSTVSGTSTSSGEGGTSSSSSGSVSDSTVSSVSESSSTSESE